MSSVFYFLLSVNICIYVIRDQQTGKLVTETVACKEQSGWVRDTLTISAKNLLIDLWSHLGNTEISVSQAGSRNHWNVAKLWQSSFSFFLKRIFEIQLIYNVVLISMYSKVVCIHIYTLFFFIFFPIMVYHRILNIVLCGRQ